MLPAPAGDLDLALELRTARCVMRPWQPHDIPHLLSTAADPEVGRWTNRPEPFDAPAAERFCAVTAAALREGWGAFLGVWCAGVLVGGGGATCYLPGQRPDTARPGAPEPAVPEPAVPGPAVSGLGAPSPLPPADELPAVLRGPALHPLELGYWLSAPARGQGLAGEALAGFCTWLEDERSQRSTQGTAAAVVQLFVRVELENSSSLRVARRTGFEEVCTRAEPGFRSEVLREVSYLVRPPVRC